MHKSLILGARMRNKADKVVELEESIKELKRKNWIKLELKKKFQQLKRALKTSKKNWMKKWQKKNNLKKKSKI